MNKKINFAYTFSVLWSFWFTFGQSKHSKTLIFSGVKIIKRIGRVYTPVRIRYLPSGHFSKSHFLESEQIIGMLFSGVFEYMIVNSEF